MHILRQFIFGKNNTFFIAHTGFNKSLIFHTYFVLTSKIIIQIILLNKLGNKQLDDIKKMNGFNPVLVNGKTRSQKKNLIAKIQKGVYMHIFFGLEQASTKSFWDALKGPKLQSWIGLVAIDKYHMVKDWESF